MLKPIYSDAKTPFRTFYNLSLVFAYPPTGDSCLFCFSGENFQIQFISFKDYVTCMVQKFVGSAGYGASRGGNVRVITAHGTYTYFDDHK